MSALELLARALLTDASNSAFAAAAVCCGMLTYADVCLTYADVCLTRAADGRLQLRLCGGGSVLRYSVLTGSVRRHKA